MRRHLQTFKDFLREAEDPSYYQETYYFTILLSMTKDVGGSRDETKNDIRALSEILTVTLVEPEKGGIQRDIGNKYLSTLKIHVRLPKDTDKLEQMKRIVQEVNNLRGCTVVRYKERKPKPRRTPFHGQYKITEGLDEANYQQLPSRRANLKKAFNTYTKGGPQKKGGYPETPEDPEWLSSPPGAPGGGAVGNPGPAGLEEAQLDEAMKTAADLQKLEGVVVAVDRSQAPKSYRAYYALADSPERPLKAGDLDRMERGPDLYGHIYASRGQNFPYEGNYVVTSVKARDKYGPLLYDVMLELVGTAGLKPDTESVSDDASAVWKFYDTHRTEDVPSAHLGPAGQPLPVESYADVMPQELAANPEKNEHLAKVYFKRGKEVLRALQENDQLVDVADSRRPDPRQELTQLAGELDIPIVKAGSDLSRFDRLREEVILQVGALSDDLLAFDVQDDLNQKIWDGDEHVRPGVKAALMDIVDEFLEGLELEADIKDVIMTGSLANYNWSKFSDIDLHILVDFNEINDNEALVKKFFDAVRSRWNKLHNILVKGHEVEIYVQDENEPHTSTGVYSLMEDRWLVKPKKIKPELDKHTAQKKMMSLVKEIDKLAALYDRGLFEDSFNLAERIKDKIRRMRKAGLERTGIYAPENLAFKMLRRSGDIERLFKIYTKSYDEIYSLAQ